MLPPTANDPPPPPPPPAGLTGQQPRGNLSPDGTYEWNGVQWVPRGYATLNPYSTPYRPARTRATVVLSIFPLWALATVALIVVEVQRLSLANTALSGTPISQDDANASDRALAVTGGLQLIVYVSLIVAFLMWLHRIVANNWALGAQGLRFTPGWAVGWWFIPFANFVQPERVVEEAWRVTATPRPSTPPARQAVGGVALVRFWWAFWLLGALISRLFVYTSTDTLSHIQSDAVVALVSSVLLLVSAVLAFVMVRSLTARQERLAA